MNYLMEGVMHERGIGNITNIERNSGRYRLAAPIIVGSARRLAVQSNYRSAPTSRFCHNGEYWMLTYHDEDSLVMDRKGLRYIAYLLRYPQREIHVLDLVSCSETKKATDWISIDRREARSNCGLSVDETHQCGLGNAGELIDNQTKSAYKQRLEELAEELNEAKRLGDEPRAIKLEGEQAALSHELRRALGLRGRPRIAAPDAEKARINVKRALKLAIGEIGGLSPKLGLYLKNSIRTGYYCSYRPDPDLSITWQL